MDQPEIPDLHDDMLTTKTELMSHFTILHQYMKNLINWAEFMYYEQRVSPKEIVAVSDHIRYGKNGDIKHIRIHNGRVLYSRRGINWILVVTSKTNLRFALQHCVYGYYFLQIIDSIRIYTMITKMLQLKIVALYRGRRCTIKYMDNVDEICYKLLSGNYITAHCASQISMCLKCTKNLHFCTHGNNIYSQLARFCEMKNASPITN